MKVCIDPGHGGKDRANVGVSGYVEADGNLKIAFLVAEFLKPYPVEVIFTRILASKSLDLDDRCKIANDAKVDLFVSIHSNAHDIPEVRGTETYHSINSVPGRGGQRLAVLVHCGVLACAGTEDHGIRSRAGDNGDYYGVIRGTNMPAVIVEVAYHSNPEDEALLKTPEFRQKAARGIAQGIVAYLGLEWIDPKTAALQARLDGIAELAGKINYLLD